LILDQKASNGMQTQKVKLTVGSSLPSFEHINRAVLKLIETKTFGGGAVTLYYKPTSQKQ